MEVDVDEVPVCEADSHPHSISFDEESSDAHYNNVTCCSLKLIYLKNYPKTLLQQVEKALTSLSVDLFVCADLHLHNFIDVGVERGTAYFQKIIDISKITQVFLCCFRC
ncbi:hypothetical protein [Ancylomarina sp. 16SWW S1-10-2]|uniref:hypothetical protein n=1 Tax=Ancylomarina sp. 16SWW S1-10-2 TaxID=2499681 RepID=UPI0012AE81D1|nr:hypothetical protein [Ancylomarina sp. 16SWW S1-10-2]MRT94264.1 hypothetical protein [Ancylomarina sp. 16SWW S1-10-2]